MAEQSRRLGERLKELREQRGWKQRDVVAAMNELGDLALNTNQLSRYENGGAFPQEDRLEHFASVFGVDVAMLIVAPPSAEPADLMEALSGETDQLTRIERKLDRVLERIEKAEAQKAAAGADDAAAGSRKPPRAARKDR